MKASIAIVSLLLVAPVLADKKKDAKHASLDGDDGGFAWLSSNKEGLRAEPEKFELLGKTVGEVVVRGRDGKVIDATVSLFNRGDDDEIPLDTFNQRMTQWKLALDEKLEVRSEVRNQQGAVALQGWMWRKGDTAVLLEGSVNRSEKRAEFIRLQMSATVPASRSAAISIVIEDRLIFARSISVFSPLRMAS